MHLGSQSSRTPTANRSVSLWSFAKQDARPLRNIPFLIPPLVTWNRPKRRMLRMPVCDDCSSPHQSWGNWITVIRLMTIEDLLPSALIHPSLISRHFAKRCGTNNQIICPHSKIISHIHGYGRLWPLAFTKWGEERVSDRQWQSVVGEIC